MSLLLAAGVLLFALALPINNLCDIWYLRDLEHNGQPAVARFGASFSCPTKLQPEAICHRLHFEVGDKAYTVISIRQDLSRGQSHPILYAPANPAYYRFKDRALVGHWHDDLAQRLLISCGLALVFGLVSVLVLKQAWRQLRASASRQAASA